MPPDPPSHPAALPEQDLMADCETRRQRRSGPGGQHRNKVETAVVITHRPTGVQGAASERRSQEENRQQALFRLRVNLALEVRTPRAADAVATSELWRNRCSNGRITVSPRHEDFPALLAESLDCLAATGWDAVEAARQLGCSVTQLIKLLQHDHRALAQLNAQRTKQGKQEYR